MFLDPATLGASLGEQITVALADPANAGLKQALLAFDAPAQGGIGLQGHLVLDKMSSTAHHWHTKIGDIEGEVSITHVLL